MKNKKIILITGASSGMGFDAAKLLIEKGHVVYGAARRIDKMKALVDLGGHAIEMDITKEADATNAVQKVISEQGKIDVLWNNAGFGLYGALEDTTIEDAKYQFDVNLFGLARLTQLVLPHMRAQSSGTIINTSSMGGKVSSPLGSWYHATKFALEGFSDCLRLELKPFNIHVVLLEPGLIETEFGEVMLSELAKRSEGGAYVDITKKVVSATKNAFKSGGASSGQVIAKAILKIVNSKKPNTRYLVGKFAKSGVFMHGIMSDKVYDSAVLAALSKMSQ